MKKRHSIVKFMLGASLMAGGVIAATQTASAQDTWRGRMEIRRDIRKLRRDNRKLRTDHRELLRYPQRRSADRNQVRPEEHSPRPAEFEKR